MDLYCLPFYFWFLTDTPILKNGCARIQGWNNLLQKLRAGRVKVSALLLLFYLFFILFLFFIYLFIYFFFVYTVYPETITVFVSGKRMSYAILKMMQLTLSMLGKTSANDISKCFLIVLKNRLWHFMQIFSLGDYLRVMWSPFSLRVMWSPFSGKKK